MRRLAALFALAVLLALPGLATARIDSPTTDSATSFVFAQAAGVTIVDFAFQPAFVEVAAGSTVSWFNAGAAPHTATSSFGAFDSGVLSSGGGFGVTLWTPGAYAYFCAVHPSMTGTVVVTG